MVWSARDVDTIVSASPIPASVQGPWCESVGAGIAIAESSLTSGLPAVAEVGDWQGPRTVPFRLSVHIWNDLPNRSSCSATTAIPRIDSDLAPRHTCRRPPGTGLMPDELDATIRQNAAGPAKVAGDAGSVEQHSLPDQIAADRYLKAKEAAASKRRGLRFSKLVPPGAE